MWLGRSTLASRHHHVGEIDNFDWFFAKPPQPFEEAGILLGGPPRQPRDPSIADGKRFLPEGGCFANDLFPACIAKLLFHPRPAQLGIGRVDRAEAEAVEKANHAFIAAGLPQRIAQASRSGRIEHNMER